MTDIFLSYSRDDQATARRFAEGFERAGFSVWWDQTLNAGEAYDEVTEKALEEAGAVAVLWSRKSVASRWVRAEATQADRNGTLVPAMIEDCRRPIMFELKQTADLSGWTGDPKDHAWQAYLASVRRLVEKSGSAGTPTPVLQPVPQPATRRSRVHPLAIALGIAVLLLAGAAVWILSRAPGDPASAVTAASASNPAVADVSLAVLPFVNMSSDPEQEYFSDGLSEELLNQLSKVPELRVIGRTSSFAFKGKNEDLRKIGETLGVNHILEGSVRKAGSQVRINAQLIKTSDGSNLWSDTYERTLEDIFAIQEEIARTVVGALQLRMGAATGNASGTKNVAAYDEFLAGRSFLSSFVPGSMEAAVPHFEKAVELDNAYIQAWLWLIDAYVRAPGTEPEARVRLSLRQEVAIDRVVALAPGSPQASFALSYGASRGRDLQTMERLLRESLALTGGQGVRARMRHGAFLLSVGRVEQAMEEWEHVRQAEPLDTFHRTNMLMGYEIAGQFERAEEEMQEILRLPEGRTSALLGTAVTRAMGQRDSGKLDSALVNVIALDGAGTENALMMQSLQKNPAAALRELRRSLEESQVRFSTIAVDNIASWAAWFGDRELALEALEKLSHQGNLFENWAFTVWRPVFKDVRREARFRALLRDAGLVDYWRATGNWGDFCKPVGADDFECR